MITVTQVDGHEVMQQARDVLVRSFLDDPISKFYITDCNKRLTLLTGLYQGVIRHGVQQHSVFTLPGKVRATAVWVMPGQETTSVLDMLRLSMVKTVLRVGIAWAFRTLSYVEIADKMRAQLAPQPHLYLYMLGVDPAYQNSGLGSQLIAPMLEKADSEHLPVYLETFNPRTLSFYKRHGFEVKAEQSVPHGGPMGWFMYRSA